MFEREIKFIYDFNLNKVNKLGPSFTFEQLSSIDLHPAILNYISAEIDYIIFEDRQKLLKDSVFDYSGEKISYYFSLINEEIKKRKRLSLEYVSKLILHATSFNINYLSRPMWTLKKFIFDEGDHRTSSEIKQILNYVYYYNYLKKILLSYINTKKILSLNFQEFDELLNKIDKAGLETNSKSILNTALNSMADFFNIGELHKNKIPLQAIILFLEEKKLDQHLRKIKVAFGNDINAKCSIIDIQKVFDSSLVEEQEELTQEEKQIDFETVDNNVDAQEEINLNVPDENVIENNLEESKANFEESVEETENLIEELYSEPEEKESSDIIEQNNEKEEDEISISHKPQKFRIRVDKDNEIEPIEESEETDEEITLSTESLNKENFIQEDESSLEEFDDEKLSDDETDELEIEDNKQKEDKNLSDEEGETLSSIFKMAKEEHIDELEKEKYNQESIEKDSLDNKTNSSIEEKEKSLNVNELLDDKEVTKIIEAIFDYDIEDFSNVLELIAKCHSLEDAYRIIDKELANRNLNPKSKEAELFKSIISEHFKSSQ
ncbi:hypothetical protein [Rosettibacter firmus]|uniref:hypothetical protein n=1 Tax=Rosettibacter firmus TaxID=3111522 RepID=UPI00336BC851